jgi:hypothetical protein
MGHIAPKTVQRMIKKGFITGMYLDMSSGSPSFCKSCVYAKATRKPVLREQEGSCATGFGDKIHSNVWGLAPTKTIHRWQYYVSFINDMSCLVHVLLMRKKSKTLHTYKEYEALVKAEYGKDIKCLNSDHSRDYMGKAFILHLKEKSTHQKLNVHNTPQHTGVSERFNHIAIERI